MFRIFIAMFKNTFLKIQPLLLFVSVSLLLGSCKKDTNDEPEPELPGGYYIKYKVNGRQVAFEGEALPGIYIGVLSVRGKSMSAPYAIHFSVYGKTPDPNEECLLEILADSVKTGDNYTWDGSGRPNGSFFNISTKSQRYGIREGTLTPAPYSMSVHINKHAGGWVSGTFSGKLRNLDYPVHPVGFEEVTITEGSFSSKVAYK